MPELTAEFEAIGADCATCAVRDANCCVLAECQFLPICRAAAPADPFRAGWAACMEWEARVPPEELDPEARELWCEGFDCAMDAPAGSGPSEDDLMRAGVWLP